MRWGLTRGRAVPGEAGGVLVMDMSRLSGVLVCSVGEGDGGVLLDVGVDGGVGAEVRAGAVGEVDVVGEDAGAPDGAHELVVGRLATLVATDGGDDGVAVERRELGEADGERGAQIDDHAVGGAVGRRAGCDVAVHAADAGLAERLGEVGEPADARPCALAEDQCVGHELDVRGN